MRTQFSERKKSVSVVADQFFIQKSFLSKLKEAFLSQTVEGKTGYMQLTETVFDS